MPSSSTRRRGLFADPDKVHYVDYDGKWVKTRGPLPTPRSPQGRPVLMQAGSSDRGRDFAARWAEAIFTDQRSLAALKAFYDDVKCRMVRVGRRPEDCAILAASTFVIGETESIARERADYLKSLVKPELWAAACRAAWARMSARSGRERPGGTRAPRASGRGGSPPPGDDEGLSLADAVKDARNDEIVGTPAQIADHLQHSSNRAHATASSSRRPISPE